MLNNLNKTIEKFFKDDELNEAKDVVKVLVKFKKLKPYKNFLKNAKKLEDMHFRIDCIKSILISEGLMEKNKSDKFGNMAIQGCEEI